MVIPTEDKQFWVRVGSPSRDEGGVVARVTVKWVHPGWDWGMTPGSEMNDVAILAADRSIDTYELPMTIRSWLSQCCGVNAYWVA
jgi:hypothetical protein